MRKGYWLFKRTDNRSYCLVYDRKQAEEIAKKNNCYIEEIWVD